MLLPANGLRDDDDGEFVEILPPWILILHTRLWQSLENIFVLFPLIQFIYIPQIHSILLPFSHIIPSDLDQNLCLCSAGNINAR